MVINSQLLPPVIQSLLTQASFLSILFSGEMELQKFLFSTVTEEISFGVKVLYKRVSDLTSHVPWTLSHVDCADIKTKSLGHLSVERYPQGSRQRRHSLMSLLPHLFIYFASYFAISIVIHFERFKKIF